MAIVGILRSLPDRGKLIFRMRSHAGQHPPVVLDSRAIGRATRCHRRNELQPENHRARTCTLISFSSPCEAPFGGFASCWQRRQFPISAVIQAKTLPRRVPLPRRPKKRAPAGTSRGKRRFRSAVTL
jgi:hypothetical protein